MCLKSVFLPAWLSLALLCSFGHEVSASEFEAEIRPGVRAGNGLTRGFVDYFLPVVQNKKALFYTNFKSVIGSQGDSEQNVGVGYRRLVKDETLLLGGNFFYDARYTPHNNYVHQLGFGFEGLTQWFDARANAYFPLTGEKLISSSDTFSFGSTSIVKTTTETFEEPMTGLDYEGGVAVPFISKYIETRVYAGGYHYDSDIAKNVNGFRGRLEIRPTSFLVLQLEVKDDHTIDTDYFAGGYISLPFELDELMRGRNPFAGWEKTIRWGRGLRSARERMTESVVRDIDIVTQDASRSSTTNAVNRVYYVNNTNASGVENGSLENPYNTLAEAITASTAGAGDWIFVDTGDGTATGHTGNFTLKNSVTLWGEGYQAFPGLGGGTRPVISGGGTGDVLTLAVDNTVEGVQIQSGDGSGIYAVNPGTLIIRNNIITDMDDAGGETFGIFIATSGANTADVTITQNTLTDFDTLDEATAISVAAVNTSQLTAVVSHNTIDDLNDGRGMSLNAQNTAVLSVNVFRNVIKNTTGSGINISSSGTPTMTIDIGGGALGSIGYNSLTSIATEDINNQTSGSIKAENNFWQGGLAGTFGGTVDGVPFLTSDPNV